MDLHINALTAHINFAVAQYSALQSDTAQRVIDDRNEEIEDLEYAAAEQRMKDLMSKAFGGLGSRTGRFSFGAPFGKEAGADLFEAIFGRRPAAPDDIPTEHVDVDHPTDDVPVPEGIFWDVTTVTFRDAEGNNKDGEEHEFFDKWFERTNDFPEYVAPTAVAQPEPVPAIDPGGPLGEHSDVAKAC